MLTKQATSTGSLAVSAGAQAVSIECMVTYIQLISNATAAATMQIYDGTSTSGVLLASLSIPATTTPPQTVSFNIPVYANKGVFYVITGTGATGIVHYVPA